MNKEEHIQVITDREELYDKCENMEQLYDKYYLPLLDKHYRKTYELQQENQKYKEVIDKLSSQIKLYGKYNGEKCTRGFSMMTADFNKLLDILKEVE